MAPEPLLRNDIQALKRDRLSWVDQNYLRDDTIATRTTGTLKYQLAWFYS
jgi:hypothetical protein